jgi:predicted Zn-dependent protease
MYGLRLLVLLCVAGSTSGCLYYSSSIGQYKTPVARQRAFSKELLPRALEVPGAPHEGAPVVLHARLYADQDYRRRPHWKAHAANLVRAANAYTAAAFGVILEASFVEWERDSDGRELAEVLHELALLDEGLDVDFVIGLCAAPATFTVSHHELGMAVPLGRHFVVRDMNDTAELQVFDRLFDKMDGKERLDLYAARKAHKELAVFVHEWAHTLGAVHESGEGRLMTPAYGTQSSTFSEADAGMIERGLVLRQIVGYSAEARQRRAQAEAALVAFLRAHAAWPEWSAGERAQMEAAVGGESVVGHGQGPTTLAPKLPAAYERAVAALREDDADRAWRELQPIVGTFADSIPVQNLACRIGCSDAGGQAALAACPRVIALDPLDTEPAMWFAGALARGAEPDDTRIAGLLDEVEARLARKQGPAAELLWLQLAELSQSIGFLSRAERALEHVAGEGEELEERRDSVRAERHLVGLPADGARVGVPLAAEAAYVRAFVAAYEQVVERGARASSRMVHAQLARFPDAPGLLALACGAEAETRHPERARKLCARALAGWDDATLAHLYSAQVAISAADATAHLERVLALDPEQREAWVELLARYAEAGNEDKVRSLAVRYSDRFHEELPVR